MYTFAQRRNRLATHFSEGKPVVKQGVTVLFDTVPYYTVSVILT